MQSLLQCILWFQVFEAENLNLKHSEQTLYGRYRFIPFQYYNHPALSRWCWSPELRRWKNCIYLILSLVLLPFSVKAVTAYFLSDCVLILSTGLLLPWPDLLWCLSRVLMRLSRKAGGVTGGLDDNYPSTPFHLTTARASTTDLISDVPSCNRTQQKGRSIGAIIDRSGWGITERSAQIDSHIIGLQPLCCCMSVINYETLQDAGTPCPLLVTSTNPNY